MEDLSAMLSQLLENPDGLETIKSLASTFLSNNDSNSDSKEEKSSSPLDIASLLSSVSPSQIDAILKIARVFNSDEQDDRSHLLLALRPHLSSEKQEKVDSAVKLLRIASVLPLLKDTGFNIF